MSPMISYAQQAAELYQEAAKYASCDGNQKADRLLRAADGLRDLAAIEKGIVPPGWQPPSARDEGVPLPRESA
jgi:hypothetical protein